MLVTVALQFPFHFLVSKDYFILDFDALSAMTERLTNYYLTTPADPTFTPEAGELCVVYIEGK